MKKAITIGLVGLLLFFGIQSHKNQTDVQDPVTNYISYSGTIREIRGEGEQSAIVVQTGDQWEDAIVFNLNQDVLLLNDSTKETFTGSFEVGQRVTAYYPENSPMAMSMPPIAQPTVIVVNSNKRVGSIHVGYFDETLTSHDGQLKIILGANMQIVDRDGKPVTKIAGKRLVVFYTTSTRSIPAQTTPEKIIVL